MGTTYEDIERVNEEIVPVDIKGHGYATVAARVQAFRKLYPEGCIETVIEDLEPKVVQREDSTITLRVVRARAYIYPSYQCEDNQYLATGVAEEIEGSSNINKVSFIENCETSAVGRALGFLGIGSTSDIATAEEVVNAQGYNTITKEQAKVLRAYIKEKGKDEKYILDFHNVKKVEDMTVKQYAEVIKWLGV